MRLKGRKILVTGASSGIGREACITIVREGGTIIAVARRENLLKELIAELNETLHSGHVYKVCDITNDEQLNDLVSSIENLDGVVHSAGMVFPLPIKFIRKKHMEKVWSLNTFAPIELTSMLLSKKLINDGAYFVFLSSISTKHPYFGGAIYVSSKAALEAYSRNLALEMASKKVRSNVLSPALVKTAIFEQTVETSDTGRLAEYESQYPFGFGTPEDIANAILFFLSNESRWITGQNLVMDGGLTLNAK
jgi:NAD(P)-dependent dehydrogenase (short-subunit alcohol dehydrogenase family)